jgi:glycosyltransferase involved in cell wall biosynthesis
MIVKDEAHIIKETLTKLVKDIKIDYWVISDTGSTDKTKEIITEFFKNLGKKCMGERGATDPVVRDIHHKIAPESIAGNALSRASRRTRKNGHGSGWRNTGCRFRYSQNF